MKPIGINIPVAWPQDGTQRRDDGKPLSDHYKRHGLRMLGEHATWPDGSVSTEAGVIEVVALAWGGTTRNGYVDDLGVS